MDNQPPRRYSAEDLNDLLHQLRALLDDHDLSVGLLVTAALLMDLLHAGAVESSEWIVVVPVLQREILRGTAQVLNAGRVMAIDDSSEMVH